MHGYTFHCLHDFLLLILELDGHIIKTSYMIIIIRMFKQSQFVSSIHLTIP